MTAQSPFARTSLFKMASQAPFPLYVTSFHFFLILLSLTHNVTKSSPPSTRLDPHGSRIKRFDSVYLRVTRPTPTPCITVDNPTGTSDNSVVSGLSAALGVQSGLVLLVCIRCRKILRAYLGYICRRLVSDERDWRCEFAFTVTTGSEVLTSIVLRTGSPLIEPEGSEAEMSGHSAICERTPSQLGDDGHVERHEACNSDLMVTGHELTEICIAR